METHFMIHAKNLMDVIIKQLYRQTVELPGITSTIKGIVSYSNPEKQTLSSSGFPSSFTGGGMFVALGTLGHLGLGFFDYLRYPINEDNDTLFHWKGAGSTATDPGDGKIVIESFVLRVPIVDYTSTSKIQLIDGLKHLSDKDALVYNFFQWQCIDKRRVFSSSFSFDITSVYRNVYNHRFVIIALHKNRTNTQAKDPSRFDSCNIKNVPVKINGERYPQELQNFDITN
ncbi:hypothetical protein J6590_095036, partial [Homalodisca vitripennis]